jgi:hypothetical protein
MDGSSFSHSDKARVYRVYRADEAYLEDVRDVFGEDIQEFEDFDALMALVDATPTNEPSDDLFC